MWVKWIWKYLIRKGSFWSVDEKSSLGSWMWKKLLKLRPLAIQLTRTEVNCGSTTSFWYENWSQLGPLIDIAGERGCMDLGISKYATVEKAIQIYRPKRHRVPTLQLIDQEMVDLQSRGLNRKDDVCLWKRENGDFKTDFITSHTWNLTRIQSPKVAWYKGIWFKGATPKFSFITWLATLNRLATGDRVLRWSPQADPTCWLCKSDMETRDHVFFECPYSKEVWQVTIKNLMGQRNAYQWDRIICILVDGLRGRSETFLVRYCFQAVAYELWHERNTRRVGEASHPTGCLIAKLDKQIRNRITSLRRRNGDKHKKTMEIWFGRG